MGGVMRLVMVPVKDRGWPAWLLYLVVCDLSTNPSLRPLFWGCSLFALDDHRHQGRHVRDQLRLPE